MTKEEAREMLKELLLSLTYNNCGELDMTLPIYDINTNTVKHHCSACVGRVVNRLKKYYDANK